MLLFSWSCDKEMCCPSPSHCDCFSYRPCREKARPQIEMHLFIWNAVILCSHSIHPEFCQVNCPVPLLWWCISWLTKLIVMSSGLSLLLESTNYSFREWSAMKENSAIYFKSVFWGIHLTRMSNWIKYTVNGLTLTIDCPYSCTRRIVRQTASLEKGHLKCVVHIENTDKETKSQVPFFWY